ncbi:protoporphyrinogen oxidase, partial [Biomphalaria glabrata]
MEKKYGSLIAGAVFGFKDPKVEATGLVRRAIEDKWASWSLSRGLQQLTDAMAASIQNTKEGEIRLDTKVTSLKRNQNGKIIVSTPSDSIEASLVISAVYSK